MDPLLADMFGCFFPSRCEPLGANRRTEVLLGGATLLNNLDETGLELLDGGNVIGKDTHLTGGGGDVDLGPVFARFVSIHGTASEGVRREETHTPVER